MIAIQKRQMTAKLNYNWMMNVSNNIKNTSSVTILHYVNPKYLWKFSNCVNQSLDQRFKKGNKAQAGELSSKARISSPVRSLWPSPHRCCRGHLCHPHDQLSWPIKELVTTSNPLCMLSPVLTAHWDGHSVTLRHGAVDRGIFSKAGGRGGSGPLVQGKVNPQQSGRRFYK